MTWVGMSRLAKYWHQMAEAKTSTPASLSGLPCSAVSTGARSAVDAISTSAACRRVARRAASSAFQSRAALAAASKAASSCWRVHSGAWAKTSPVAGLRTPNVPSVGAASPAIVMTKSDMALLDCSCGRRPPTADPTILPPAPVPLNGAGSASREEPGNERIHRVSDPHPQGTVPGCGGNEGGGLVEETQEQRGGDLGITGHGNAFCGGPGKDFGQQGGTGHGIERPAGLEAEHRRGVGQDARHGRIGAG